MVSSSDNTLTKADMTAKECQMLNAGEIQALMSDTTITAKYYFNNRWFLAKTNSYPDGSIVGENHVGTHDEGRWSVDEANNTLKLEWDGYWEEWTAVGYKAGDEYMFFNVDTGTWRITFISVEKGKLPIDDI